MHPEIEMPSRQVNSESQVDFQNNSPAIRKNANEEEKEEVKQPEEREEIKVAESYCS